MSYLKRLALLIGIDSVIVLTSVYFSNFLLLGSWQSMFTPSLMISSLTLLVSHHLLAYKYKLYQREWRYASIGELISIFKSISLSVGITFLLQMVLYGPHYYRIMLITWMLHLLLIGGSRFSWRMYRDGYRKVEKPESSDNRTLIIGAGSAGTLVARQLKLNPDVAMQPVAYIDDDPAKRHLEMFGLPVVGGRDKIVETVNTLNITNIVIAIPSLKRKELNEIVRICSQTKAKVRIVPMFEDLIRGTVSVQEMREVQIEDLLGRDPVELDTQSIEQYITGSTVLVTGAGGSIGSEICRQLIAFAPDRVVLLGHGENSIYTIERELLQTVGKQVRVETEIADVQNRDRMIDIMKTYRPKAVFHAAAHKHVPLMEKNPGEAIRNNIIGTRNAAEAAHLAGVEIFVMISTDKAVNPTSVMGASKRVAEMLIQDMDRISLTRFVAVRFGNVLGSRGSVIPLFQEQIRKGGPVTVTHPDMIRYFMTIPEASRLVLQAAALAGGGEIFVLDMGEPVKIVHLAENLIRLSGFEVEDIGIQYSGIRPGEKLYEELLHTDEMHEQQIYPKIYVGKADVQNLEAIRELLRDYEQWEDRKIREQLLMITNKKRPRMNKPLAAAN
ncbi:polysaccharide biosynthesis protein [Paenibacillus senegalensis]|uniref:polysaccharide biosynthesis protein n=1 Tax=Paenibacillus senegalensis TaxID=1465766 RepID=UPI00028A2928|nr:nucleoside-diphosphate sugar epimerase/dehydratase [Paenibacillus senegalensis]